MAECVSGFEIAATRLLIPSKRTHSPNTSAMDQLNAYVIAAGLTKSALNLNGLPTRQRESLMKVLTGLMERRQVGSILIVAILEIADCEICAGRPCASRKPRHSASDSLL